MKVVPCRKKMANENENVSPSSGFIGKLWHLVNCESTNNHIKWTENGDGFHITNGAKLAEEILPVYFKHNNISSFIRQLNMYGFRKVNRPETGLARMNSNDLQFTHPNFHRDKGHLLRHIHRKNVGNHRSGTPINDNFGNSSLDVYRRYRDESEDSYTDRDMSQLLVRFEHLKQSHDESLQLINALRTDKEKLRIQVERLMDTCNRNNYIINQLVSIFLPRMTKDQLAQAQLHGLTKLQITAPQSDQSTKTIRASVYDDLGMDTDDDSGSSSRHPIPAVDGQRPAKIRRGVVLPSGKSSNGNAVSAIQNYQSYSQSAGAKRRLGNTNSGLVIEELNEDPVIHTSTSNTRPLRLIMPSVAKSALPKQTLPRPQIHLPMISQPHIENKTELMKVQSQIQLQKTPDKMMVPSSSNQPPPLVRSPSFPFSEKLEELFNLTPTPENGPTDHNDQYANTSLIDQQYGNLNSIIGNKSSTIPFYDDIKNFNVEGLSTPQIPSPTLELCNNNAGLSCINNACESHDLDALLDFGGSHSAASAQQSPSMSPDDFQELLVSPESLKAVMNSDNGELGLEEEVNLNSPSSPPLLAPSLPRVTTASVVQQPGSIKKEVFTHIR